MADIELVIKIPEETVNGIKDNAMFAKDIADRIKWDITSAVVKGVPLPKGHGRIGDLDALRCENTDFDTYNDYCIMFDEIEAAETIIEADKAESEDKE